MKEIAGRFFANPFPHARDFRGSISWFVYEEKNLEGLS
jgi:hypothetical protein